MMRRKNDCPRTTSIKDIIYRKTPELIQNKALEKGAEKQMHQENMIIRQWETICGQELARHLRPTRFINQELIIEADSGLWLEQARFLECEIIKRIKELIPHNPPGKIIFRVGFFHKKEPRMHENERQNNNEPVLNIRKKAHKKIRMRPARTDNPPKVHHRTSDIIREFLELFR